jgi:hypothetical protein
LTTVRRRILVPAIVFAALLAGAPSAHAIQPLTTGITDSSFGAKDPGVRTVRFDDAKRLGASIVQIDLSWIGVVGDRAPAGDLADPANPTYDWSAVDAAVRDAAGRGLTPMFNVVRAPTWAEGPGRPANVEVGYWRPNPAAFVLFAQAAARRYSGSFQGLPRVRRWGVWNEPNIVAQFAPQWDGVTPVSPATYRSLVNALYQGVKSVSGANIVVAGGLSPYGNPPGGDAMRPALFAREFFCLGANLRPKGCSDPPHFDVFSHHPYDVGGPLLHAQDPDDVATPDMSRLTRIVRAAERAGTALPRHRKRIWVTEFSYDSNPPDPAGIPIQQHALWAEYSLYLLWRAGVDTILWFQVRDQLPSPNYGGNLQGALEFNDGQPKPAAQAFRFPFVSERASKKKIRVWGKAPDRGRVIIERLVGSRWRRLAVLRPGSNRVFYALIRFSGRATLRARSKGGAVSMAWPARVNLLTT